MHTSVRNPLCGDSLGLREGVRGCALFKAAHVILSVPA
jgi:hypothetical protein